MKASSVVWCDVQLRKKPMRIVMRYQEWNQEKKYGRFTTLDILKYEHFTRKIKKTYSLLVCPSWFPAFSGVFTLAFPISTFRYPVRSHHGQIAPSQFAPTKSQIAPFKFRSLHQIMQHLRQLVMIQRSYINWRGILSE